MTVAVHGALEQSLTRTLEVVAGVIISLTVLAGVAAAVVTFSGYFTASVPVVSSNPIWPQLGGPELNSGTYVTYNSVRLATDDAPLAADLLRLASWGVYGAIVLAGCIFVILLCRRIRDDRPFTSLARWWMIGLGALAVVGAVAAPLLSVEAVAVTVNHLGFLTYDATATSYLEAGTDIETEALWPDRFDRPTAVLRHVNWLLVGFGGILLTLAFAFQRGERLQHDTEGLI